jgi:hypothetical protein
MTTIATEEAWLEQLANSKMVGISLLDADGHLVQRIDDDPAFREVVIEYQAERVRQLRLSEMPAPVTGSGGDRIPATYPNLEA